MIDFDQLDRLLGPLTQLYEDLVNSIVELIARRVRGADIASASWQVQRLIESGALYSDVLLRVSRLSGVTTRELRRIFSEAGVTGVELNDRIYAAAGMKVPPRRMTPAMVRALQAGLTRTGGLVDNLTRTTALAAQRSFLHATDVAYLQVTSGALDYTSAIRRAAVAIADAGLGVIQYPNGRADQVNVAVRRAVLTGVAQTVGVMQVAQMEDLGLDLVQTSAHYGARPTHMPWQGRVFSLSGRSTRYPDFRRETGYGTGPGLMGWNCRHTFFPFFEGVSQELYGQPERRDLAGKRVTYNGRSITVYEASQLQRAEERAIRALKRRAVALQGAGMDPGDTVDRIRRHQANLRALVGQTGLPREYSREGGRLPRPPGG